MPIKMKEGMKKPNKNFIQKKMAGGQVGVFKYDI